MQRCAKLVCARFIAKSLSDIPRDHCHGLNQSATRIGGHDNTIRLAYSIVCRMRVTAKFS